jgi:L,D-peptidoglycan transpeptidase YkuD (ErfK/YbiS/YcfS/YnhG family)
MVVEAISAAMKAAVRRIFAARPCPLLAAGLLAAASLVALGTGPAGAAQTRFTIPASARQLVVVSSPTYDPANYLARFQSFARASATSAWKPVFATWETEIGSGELRDVRREGDHATPTGVYGFGLATIYGAWPNPGGLHAPYHRFVCGDWWDEDPYSAQYNRFVHVACTTTPPFAAWSEPLWEETEGDRGYPYLVVIDYNLDPTIAGPDAPGSGIFLHAWMDAPTEGCIALPISELLAVLRWLEPKDHPVVEIGTDAEVGRVPPPT